MAMNSQGGIAQRVAQLAVARLRNIAHSAAQIPQADFTDDPVAVVLRYIDQANPDDYVLASGADKHLDGDEPGEREIQQILAALAPGDDTLAQAVSLLESAVAQDMRAHREQTNHLSIRFSIDLGRRARAHRGTYLNPKRTQSVAGVLTRRDYIRISIHHIGPGHGA